MRHQDGPLPTGPAAQPARRAPTTGKRIAIVHSNTKYTAIQSPTECSNAYLPETMQVLVHGEEISNTNLNILSDCEHQLKHDDPINQQAQKP